MSASPRASQPWLRWAIYSGAALIGLVLAVLLARWFRSQDFGENFISTYPGHGNQPENTPEGFPAWLSWQHFFNAFFMVFVVRSGWLIRQTARPAAYWQRNNTGILQSKNPPVRISINQWFHLAVDSLWVLNGAVFFILLFISGHWKRIVPTNGDVFPNAVSAGIQYLSLDWPQENSWVYYNSLQLLIYFVTVFIAAPLAILTGLRMVPGLARRFKSFEKIYPISWARKLHLPIMLYFISFVIVHVTLVFATGALRNLNHMYAGSQEDNWLGFWIFAASLVVLIGAWFAARPLLFRSVAGWGGKVTR